jgi:hypothetical protein
MRWVRGVGLVSFLAACSPSAPPEARSIAAAPRSSAPAPASSQSAAPAPASSSAPASNAEGATASTDPATPNDTGNAAAEAPPLTPASDSADYVSALQNNPLLLTAMLGGVAPDPKSPLDHPQGLPLPEVCALESVAWHETPTLYGLESIAQVKDRADAVARKGRSYAHIMQKLIDFDRKKPKKKRHPGAELAMIGASHWAPGADGVMVEWAELYFFGLENCVVKPLFVARTGARPVTELKPVQGKKR